MDDPLDDDELRVAKRLLEGHAAARGISGLDLPEGRLREAVAGSGLEFRLSVSLIHALGLPPDLFLRPPLDRGAGEPAAGGEPVRDSVLANLDRLGAALPPAPPLSPAEARGLLARCERIAARSTDPPPD